MDDDFSFVQVADGIATELPRAASTSKSAQPAARSPKSSNAKASSSSRVTSGTKASTDVSNSSTAAASHPSVADRSQAGRSDAKGKRRANDLDVDVSTVIGASTAATKAVKPNKKKRQPADKLVQDISGVSLELQRIMTDL